MANFASQIKDKFLGLIDRVAGYGHIGGEKDKVQEPANTTGDVFLPRACGFAED